MYPFDSTVVAESSWAHKPSWLHQMFHSNWSSELGPNFVAIVLFGGIIVLLQIVIY